MDDVDDMDNVVNTVRCAVCGKLRERTNHWFLIWLTFGFHCYPFDIAPRQEDDLPVCGQACAQKEFERWMTGVSTEQLLVAGR